jgi:hypothetical protein
MKHETNPAIVGKPVKSWGLDFTYTGTFRTHKDGQVKYQIKSVLPKAQTGFGSEVMWTFTAPESEKTVHPWAPSASDPGAKVSR